MAVVFTIGHSTHSFDEFGALLARHRVQAVADVRRFPASRRHPHFGGDALAAGLPSRGVAYVHLPALGGRRSAQPDSPNGGWDVGGFRGYADHMAGPEFAAGLAQLEELARDRPTAVMCAEGMWWRCHRRLVSDALLVRGWEVRHILPGGAVTPHELTPFAVVEGTSIVYPPAQLSLE